MGKPENYGLGLRCQWVPFEPLSSGVTPMEKGASKNVELVGYQDLEGRPAFKVALQVVRERWYIYLSHFWTPGWSILEVTEPAW